MNFPRDFPISELNEIDRIISGKTLEIYSVTFISESILFHLTIIFLIDTVEIALEIKS